MIGNKKTVGFTVIELLTVIAILAIFMLIVYSFISSVRARAHDAVAVRNLNDLRTYADIYYVNHGNNYGGLFDQDSNRHYLDSQVQNLMTNGGIYSNRRGAVDPNNNQRWYAIARLKAKPTKVYCVDSDFLNVIIPASKFGLPPLSSLIPLSSHYAYASRQEHNYYSCYTTAYLD